MSNETPKLRTIYTRLFEDDVKEIQRIAALSALPWQIELRLLVRRALRGERRDVVVLKDQQ